MAEKILIPEGAPKTREAMIAALERHATRHDGLRADVVAKQVAKLKAATGVKAIETAMFKAADCLMNFLEREEKILDRIEADNKAAEERFGKVVELPPEEPDPPLAVEVVTIETADVDG